MAEQNCNPKTGDPDLGPDDARVEIKCVLVGQKGILTKADCSVPLLCALTPDARGAVACAIETGFQWTAQNVVRKINELILQRSKAERQRTKGEHLATQPPIDDYPTTLPKPPPKTDPPTSL